jgi:hypothetical protein
MATEAAIVSWTPANWITVVLMVAIVFFVVGAGARIWQQKQANQSPAGS